MPTKPTKRRRKQSPEAKRKDAARRQLARLDKKIQAEQKKLQEARGGRVCHLFLGFRITRDVVETVFEELQTKALDCLGRLDVVVDSGGGDIDAAYNLGTLFRRFGTDDLTFIVPRWAKSAATLLVCSGNQVLMSPVAELGPLDPQITAFNPLERRLEQFSPLHLEPTLKLIRDEFQQGRKELAAGLTERLQFPLTLGGIKNTIEIGKQYLQKLLASRMFKGGEEGERRADEVAQKLTEGYADHGMCINLDEAEAIGLEVAPIPPAEFEPIWSIYKLHKEKQGIRRKLDEQRAADMMRNLPPEILEKLGPLPSGGQPEVTPMEGS